MTNENSHTLQTATDLCKNFRSCNIRHYAKNALRVLNHFGYTPPDSVKNKVLGEFGRIGLKTEFKGSRVTICVVKGDHQTPLLVVSNRWIEAAHAISVKVLEENAVEGAVVDNRIKMMLNEIKEMESWKTLNGLGQTFANQGTTKVKTIAQPEIWYSKDLHAWVFNIGKTLHKFETKEAAASAYQKHFKIYPTIETRRKHIGLLSELPKNSVWSGEWDKINKREW